MARITPILKNVAAFLDMLAFSEGTIKYGNDDGYNVIVGGSLFDDYSDHPRIKVYEKKDEFIHNNKKDYSTAAGRYQLLSKYFNPYKKVLLLPDFSPVSQDKIAIQMIKEQGALKLVIDGKIEQAIANCSNIWASLPGAGYGQHEHKLTILLNKFVEYGGKLYGS